MKDSIFTKIVKRELPAEVLYEDDTVIVILNRFPNIPGETLVISKRQVPYIFDLVSDEYDHLLRISKMMAHALDRTFATLRTCMVVEGFDVPHVHVRLYPVIEEHLDLSQGPEASDEELKEVGDKIRQHIKH